MFENEKSTLAINVLTQKGVKSTKELEPGDIIFDFYTGRKLTVEKLTLSAPGQLYMVQYSDGRTSMFTSEEYIYTGESENGNYTLMKFLVDDPERDEKYKSWEQPKITIPYDLPCNEFDVPIGIGCMDPVLLGALFNKGNFTTPDMNLGLITKSKFEKLMEKVICSEKLMISEKPEYTLNKMGVSVFRFGNEIYKWRDKLPQKWDFYNKESENFCEIPKEFYMSPRYRMLFLIGVLLSSINSDKKSITIETDQIRGKELQNLFNSCGISTLLAPVTSTIITPHLNDQTYNLTLLGLTKTTCPKFISENIQRDLPDETGFKLRIAKITKVSTSNIYRSVLVKVKEGIEIFNTSTFLPRVSV